MQNAALHMDIFAQQSLASGDGWRWVTPVASPQWAARLCILLVEDDEGDAYLIKRALARNARVGEIVLAENGVEALDLIDRGIVTGLFSSLNFDGRGGIPESGNV